MTESATPQPATTPTETPRRRAPGMSTEQRREMILQTALPLVAEYGSKVTTAQIARAAGIGEATVFRVFADKDELLRAVVKRAMDPTNVLQHLETIALEQPLADRLVEAAETLEAHLGRMGAVIGSLHSTGHPMQRSATPDALRSASTGREQSQAATLAAVAELFEPERDQLRLAPQKAAAVFLTFAFTRGRSPLTPDVTVNELVDLFLHGALT
ncbi:TetR/AcrR family transcriptional regulator [Dactylosporangium matsuzakiense]|nr:TetR/AcrR family transcriptional regulator [Dactylosporangium matsuzakiense]UWZ47727.1 TetR/AcrR family transcriptional regulator [Dactylosporangium matsuzakiense]